METKWQCRCGALYSLDILECPLCKRPGENTIVAYRLRRGLVIPAELTSQQKPEPKVEFQEEFRQDEILREIAGLSPATNAATVAAVIKKLDAAEAIPESES